MSIGIIADSYVSGSYSSAVLADNPLGYWRLGDTTAQDPYLAHTNGGIGGGLLPYGGVGRKPGPFAGSYSHYVNNYGYHNTQNNIGQFSKITVEAWIKTTATSGNIFNCRSDSTPVKSMSLAIGAGPIGGGGPGRLWWGADGASLIIGVASNTAINDGNWHHVVATWDGVSGTGVSNSQMKIYIDGVQAATTALSQTGGVSAPLGGNGPYGVGSFSGYTARPAIYSGVALTATQVNNHYSASNYDSAVLADNPSMFWTLEENLTSNSYLQDASPNVRTGYYSGTVTKQVAGLVSGSTNTAVQFSPGYAKLNYDSSWMNQSAATSVECIFKLSAIAGTQALVARYESSAADWRLVVNSDGSITWSPWANGNWWTTNNTTAAGSVVANTRYHLVATCVSSGALNIYLNGTLVKSTTIGSRGQYNTPGLLIGSEAGSSITNGVIDEVAYYGTALTQARVTAHAKAAGF